jgi:hypothetical protein
MKIGLPPRMNFCTRIGSPSVFGVCASASWLAIAVLAALGCAAAPASVGRAI